MDAAWLLNWTPFKIDALGLVTLLGADEINRKVGRLCISRVTEFLPLVGGYVVADGSFASAISGLTVYNITDGICATDVAGWFSRWLLCQKLTYNSTTLTIGTVSTSRLGQTQLHNAAIFGLVASVSMISLAIMIRDWWGLANAVALSLSVVARFSILTAVRTAVDRGANRATTQSAAIVKTFWRLPDGSSLVIYTTRGILTECLLTKPQPAHRGVYSAARAVAWAAFLVHILSLGMAALPSQLICVGILAMSTMSAVLSFGIRHDVVGSRLQIRRTDNAGWRSGSMAAAFARLGLTSEEEQSMMDWKLMPLFSNRVWWEKYRDLCVRDDPAVYSAWKSHESWKEYERRQCQRGSVETQGHLRAV